MTPVYKLSASSVKNGRTVYGSMLAGNTAFAPTSFESVATVSVGSGGAANVEFTSIPATYAHLQIRYITRNESATDTTFMRFNNDTGNNYAYHRLRSNADSSPIVTSYSSVSLIEIPWAPYSTSLSNAFSSGVIDILDYTNTNKYKTIKVLGGAETNGDGFVGFNSGLWQSTNAITSIKFVTDNGTDINQYSHFALYGIKAAA